MEKLADGWLPGKPLYGYKTIGENKHKIHIPDTDKVPLAIKLFETYLEPSHSLTTVTKYAAEIGIRTSKGRPYSRSTLAENILANPFYIGTNRWQGVDYPNGKQETFISKDLWEAVQAKLHRKTPPKYHKHDPDLRGIMFCSNCGGTIGWEFQKGTWYSHCNRYKGCPKKKYATQKVVEDQLFKHFEKLLCPSPEIAEWIVGALKAKHHNDMYDYSATVEQLHSQHDHVKRALDLLYEDRLSERISVEVYDRLSKEKVQQQAELEEQINGVADRSRKQLRTGIDVLEKSQQAAAVYATKSPAEKRILLSELFTSLKLDGTELQVTYNPYTEVISKRVEKHRKVVKDFRTKENTPNNGGATELVTALHTVWRARPDSNRRSPP
jgi:hypothetical protein